MKIGDKVKALVRINHPMCREPKFATETVTINSVDENEFGAPFYGCKNSKGKQVYFTNDKIQTA